MKTFQLALTFGIAALLGGCAATPNEIRQKPPRLYQSNKPPELVAACIFEQYDGEGGAKLIEISQRSDGGKTVKAPFGHAGTIRFVIDITPTSAGSKIAFYEHTLIQAFDRKHVAACGVPLG